MDAHFRYVWAVTVLVSSIRGQDPAWRRLTPEGAAPFRSYPALAYNSASDRLIVFGGWGNTVAAGTGVWILTNASGRRTSQWLQLIPDNAPGAPAVRSVQDAAYDPIGNRLLVFSGDNCGVLLDSWVLSDADGTTGSPTWSRLAPTGGIPPGAVHVTGYDPSSNRLLIALGSSDLGGCPSMREYRAGEAWVLTNANGTEPAAPAWIKLTTAGSPPPGRSANQITTSYDASTNRLIMFGGANNEGFLNDVWVLTNANGLGGQPTWVELSAGPAPPSRRGAAGFYDTLTNQLVVFGGDDGGSPFHDLWILKNANGLGGSPSWRQVNAPVGILGRTGAAAVFSPTTGQMILFGGILNPGLRSSEEVWLLDRALQPPGPPCSYQLAPTSASYPASGGRGAVAVRTTAGCPLSITLSDSWLKTVPILTAQILGFSTVGYAVAPNGGGARAGFISIGSAVHSVQQAAGAAACSFAISPGSQTVPSSGGTVSVNVTTSRPECTWSVTGQGVSWATVVAGAKGSGNGTATFNIQANAGLSRETKFDIGGRTFQLYQAPSDCGALDVTHLVRVTSGPFFSEFLGASEAQEITVRNTSSSVIAGPVFMVFDGLPRVNSSCPNGCSVLPSELTFCNSRSGSAMIALTLSALPPNAAVKTVQTFYPGPAGSSAPPSSKFRYTPRVLSGRPNQ